MPLSHKEGPGGAVSASASAWHTGKESRPDREEVISKGYIWSGAKTTRQETAKNWIKNFVLVMR